MISTAYVTEYTIFTAQTQFNLTLLNLILFERRVTRIIPIYLFIIIYELQLLGQRKTSAGGADRVISVYFLIIFKIL